MIINARIQHTTHIADSIKRIQLSLSEPIEVSPGSHVTIELPITPAPISRSYSVVEIGIDSLHLTIAVKCEASGRGGSQYICELELGDELVITGYGNSLPVSYGASRYVVIAGGIGVTPMMSIAHSLRASGQVMHMHYAAHSVSQAAFVPELQALLGEHLSLYFSDQGQRLELKNLFSSINNQTLVYACGPLRLLTAIRAEWQQRDLPVQNLRFESFANSGGMAAQRFQITVEETKKTLTVEANQSILDALIASGHEVMYDCRKGECGLCRSVLIQNDTPIDHRDVFFSEAEKARGDSLCLCVSRLAGGHGRISINGVHHGKSPLANYPLDLNRHPLTQLT